MIKETLFGNKRVVIFSNAHNMNRRNNFLRNSYPPNKS